MRFVLTTIGTAAVAFVTLAISVAQSQAAGASVTLAQSAVSGLEGLVLVPLTSLPPPSASVATDFCDQLIIEPKTRGGEVVKALGWAVTDEVSLGAIDAVSFVGGFEPGTSGSCLLSDGNVGLFEGDQLRWLVYGETGTNHSIGTIAAFETTAVRIWSGDFLSQPVADLSFDAGGAPILSRLADVESFCDGKALVPNIYGIPIADARKKLQQSGWAPVLGILPGDMSDGRSEELKSDGLIEVEGCSGTGYGYCSFGYAGQFAELSVVTVGEGEAQSTPDVAGYSVSCAIPEAQ